MADFLFDKDPLFARNTLSDDEFALYEKIFLHLKPQVPVPDLVVYLQAPTDLLLKRLRERARDPEQGAPRLDPAYVKELNEAYQHYFFHYSTTPLLVVETSHIDFGRSDEAVDDLIRQIAAMGRGTQYYVPRK